MRKFLLAALLLSVSHPALADGPYKILRTVTVGGEGGFDYIVADSDGRRLYIARSGKINPRLLAFDLDSLKQAGELDGISAHGAVVDPANHHGFASSKPLTMFDSTTTATLKSITVDGDPDGLSLDAAAHRVYVLSHSAPNITAINTVDGSISARSTWMPRSRKPSPTARAISMSRSRTGMPVGVVDANTMWSPRAMRLPAKAPRRPGLALDAKTRVLFVACRNPQAHGDDECRYRRDPATLSHRRPE